jgi:HipA-like protein
MAKKLDLYLFKDLIGHLLQDDGGQMVFDYAERWIEKLGACPLSQSLPLRRERFARKECRGFFSGILPEESKREIIVRSIPLNRDVCGGEFADHYGAFIALGLFTVGIVLELIAVTVLWASDRP